MKRGEIMKPIILSVETLPAQIRSKFKVSSVIVKEEDENIILTPVKETAERGNLWGLLSDGSISTEKFMEQKRKDRELEL